MQVKDISTTDSNDLLTSNPPIIAQQLSERFLRVRRFTEALCKPLVPEDYVIQSMPDVSPTKWHLAHTSWFFETFILRPYLADYPLLDDRYPYLFNSYYIQAGDRHCRAHRGLLSRPTVQEVYQYRNHIDVHMEELLRLADASLLSQIAPLIEIGINHEQQHQELMLTDIKHVFSINPLYPVYQEASTQSSKTIGGLSWSAFDEGLFEIGHDGEGFSFDNEMPKHRTFVQPFELANRLITNREYLEFMKDGGYKKANLWLSMGWATVQEQGWEAPMYWEKFDEGWKAFTLAGLRSIDLDEPVCHVSYFEADAFARWTGYRLPTEQEWEIAAMNESLDGNYVDAAVYHPSPAEERGGLEQMYGEVWQWTQSQYSPYPGYQPAEGALGEYNGKFMCNQFVLRGASCATSRSHARRSYRNFFPPDARWQFTGIRLAQ